MTEAKGLSDLRTAITRRLASKPPRKETAYLDLYSLGMEKQRLEKELSRLEQRKKRLLERLEEIAKEMKQKEQVAHSSKPERSSNEPEGPWKKIVINY